MIIANIPIKASQTLRILIDWLQQLFSKPDPAHSESKFAFVYFSYQPDFEFLELSLRSLVEQVDRGLIGKIFLFIDQKAPFSEQEIANLKQLYPALITSPIYGFSWASTETTLAELGAFLEVSQQIADVDLITKVDSDILFFKNNRLKRIAGGAQQAMGDGHHVDYQYAQGGLYFIRNKLFKRTLALATETSVKEAEINCNNKGEDIVISTLLEAHEKAFNLSRFMLFPDEYQKITQLNRLSRWEFCALHFVKDKNNMAPYYQKFILKDKKC